MTLQDFLVVIIASMPFLLISLVIIYKIDRRPAQIITPENPELEKYIQFPFGQLWVYDSDSENSQKLPPLVFIHSIGSSIFSWRFQIPELQKTHRVIAFDLLGFGKSDKPLDQDYNLDAHTQRILDLLNYLEIDQCSLVGCSLGGALALWMGSQTPHRFQKIVAIAPAAVTSVVPFYHLKHHSLSPLATRLISRSIIRIALTNSYSYRKNITVDVVEQYFAPFAQPNAMTCFLRTVDAIKDQRIFNHLKNIKTPTLILWGENDRVVRKKDIENILSQMKLALKKFHPSGGHHLMEDEPQWTNENILSFLKKQS